MKKVFLTSVASLAIVFPALANIGQNATNATCDSATIGATSGDANLQAAWQANTINLDWYSNGEQIDVTGTDSATCTYDGTITLPSDPQEPTGYTFGGWKVRVAPAQSGFDLSTWEYGTVPDWDEEYIQYISNNGNATMGTTTGLNNGEWRIAFGNGTVKGEARCSTVGEWATASTPTDDLDLNDLENGAQYCWCKATSVDTLGNGSYTPVASSSWVFYLDDATADYCAYDCAYDCAGGVRDEGDFRRALFGISE